MRILDRLKIPYTHMSYEAGEFVDGIQTADKLGLPHEKVFKTLVTEGNDKNHYVFVIPIEKELDLKACARSVGGPDRVRPRRLHFDRYEEAVCHEGRQFGREAGQDLCQRRKDRLPDRAFTG